MEGYIKLFRQILDWRWFRDPAVAHLFVYLLLRANYTDAEWRDITIKRGQLVTTRDTLIHDTGLTESMIKRGLRVLKRTEEIQTTSTNQYTVITISKYDVYQGNICNGDQTTSSEKPTVEQQTTTRKEYKKDKKRIDSSLRSESSSSTTTCDGSEINFLAFMDFFNRTMQENGAQIPTITDMTLKRCQAVRARAKEYTKEALRKAVINAATAPFLNGAGDKAWVADFNWIFRPVNFVKVLEGTFNHAVINQNSISDGTNNKNGYRSREDMLKGTVRVMSELIEEGDQYTKPLPVV